MFFISIYIATAKPMCKKFIKQSSLVKYSYKEMWTNSCPTSVYLHLRPSLTLLSSDFLVGNKWHLGTKEATIKEVKQSHKLQVKFNFQGQEKQKLK